MVSILDNTEKGAEVLLEVMVAGSQVRAIVESRQFKLAELTDLRKQDVRNTLKLWLDKARELAKEFSPEAFSVGVNVPFVGSVNFTWSDDVDE